MLGIGHINGVGAEQGLLEPRGVGNVGCRIVAAHRDRRLDATDIRDRFRDDVAGRREIAQDRRGQDDDVGGMAANARDFGIANEFDRIRPASILRDARVVKIDVVRFLVRRTKMA